MNPDHPTHGSSADRSRINVEQDYEVRYWSGQFGVSPEELRQAVKKVGPMMEAVRRELSTIQAARSG